MKPGIGIATLSWETNDKEEPVLVVSSTQDPVPITEAVFRQLGVVVELSRRKRPR